MRHRDNYSFDRKLGMYRLLHVPYNRWFDRNKRIYIASHDLIPLSGVPPYCAFTFKFGGWQPPQYYGFCSSDRCFEIVESTLVTENVHQACAPYNLWFSILRYPRVASHHPLASVAVHKTRNDFHSIGGRCTHRTRQKECYVNVITIIIIIPNSMRVPTRRRPGNVKTSEIK